MFINAVLELSWRTLFPNTISYGRTVNLWDFFGHAKKCS